LGFSHKLCGFYTNLCEFIGQYPSELQKKRPKMKNGNNEMKERKLYVDRKEAISRLRTGYTRATHGPKLEGVSNSLCPFATPIYPSSTYCVNANKLRTRERTWTFIKNNGTTGKKVWKR
jgi:hypothetical protein